MKTQIHHTHIDDVMNIVSEKMNSLNRRPVLYLPGNAGRIDSVEKWVFEHADALNKAYLFQTLTFAPAQSCEEATNKGVTYVTPFIGPGVRKLVNEGRAENIRSHLSQVHLLFEHQWRPDVAIAHVSTPDKFNRVTLGLNAGLDISAVRAAQFRVAVINTQLPRFHIGHLYDLETNQYFETGCAMNLSEFDVVIEIDEPLFEHAVNPAKSQSDTTNMIAEHIIRTLQEDSDDALALPHIFQLGIGMIPDATAQHIASQNITIQGVWSEMFSNGVLDLLQKGLVKNTGGRYLRDHVVVGFVLGNKELYAAMHDNPSFAVLPQEIVNNPHMISCNRSMVSINTALAVSVTGEVVAASIGTSYFSGVGGQKDFAEGASNAPGGRAIIAVPSMTKPRKGVPFTKIVATHPSGSHQTISAYLPITLVTEFGPADLRYIPDTKRIERVLAVAHPDMRTRIAQEVRLLPAMKDVLTFEPEIITLSDKSKAVVRPSKPSDISKIDAYIWTLSKENLQTRFMGTIKHEALTLPSRLKERYEQTIDFNRKHAVFVVEQNSNIVGVTHAFEDDNKPGVYALSFSRKTEMRGSGIGDNLMRALLQWGNSVDAHVFTAEVLSHNVAMRELFERWNFSFKQHTEDATIMVCTAPLVSIRAPEYLSKTA